MTEDIHSRCESCGRLVRSFDTIRLSSEDGKATLLCSKCYNEFAAKNAGLDFQHVDFEPITLHDIDGIPHKFEFRTHVFGGNVSIEALEIRNGQPKGYELTVHGDAEDDMLHLFGKLFEKMRRALERKHIEKGNLTRYQITNAGIVRGHITWDDDQGGRVPCLVVDGKELSWEEFGRMLMTYEGFNLKLEVFEPSDER
ncbi:MAG: hypothetical protein AB1512_25520 [Thermodesulfobacteriota bacterium]